MNPPIALSLVSIPSTSVVIAVQSTVNPTSYEGQFIQYNIFDNLFKIMVKYRPSIMPIGCGAYGIVWQFI
ncbi:Mitogen-activated protein kinase, partial [Sarracenia purpurea var. burkii]